MRDVTSRAWSLRRRILLGLIAYIAVLSAAITTYGYVINERGEFLVWESLLQTELDYFLKRRSTEPETAWATTEPLELYSSKNALPEPLASLKPGVHDDVFVEGRERVVLVKDLPDERVVLALSIGALERREETLGGIVAVATLGLVAVLSLLALWGVNRLIAPMRKLANAITDLRPQQHRDRLTAAAGASAEILVIVDALNGFLQRNTEFVERERAFVDTASHELRTPVSVISGAAQNGLSDPTLGASTRHQLERIRATAADIEALTAVLLVLAKDPSRLDSLRERVAVADVLGAVVEDHRHLCDEKALTIRLDRIEPCEILAPPHMVRSAIGNLVRNAIENSDRGDIVISLTHRALVEIVDPGHGMSPEEISAIYASVARGCEPGGGIGLPLIGRLCQHLGWRLDIESGPGRGSRIALQLGSPTTTIESTCADA